MPETDRTVIERITTGKLLLKFYNKHAAEWGNRYPKVKNPRALIEGLESICARLGDGQLPDAVILYVIDKQTNPEEDPELSEYVIVVQNESYKRSDGAVSYSISLRYRPTRETEAITLIEEDNVVWSADKVSNSQHPTRTKYYMGFAYMICEQSPGFEIEPLPEVQLTGADLIALGVEGELPPEIIEIPMVDEAENVSAVPETQNESESAQHEWDSLFDSVDESLQGASKPHREIDNAELNNAEDEYNDLLVDFEELFN